MTNEFLSTLFVAIAVMIIFLFPVFYLRDMKRVALKKYEEEKKKIEDDTNPLWTSYATRAHAAGDISPSEHTSYAVHIDGEVGHESVQIVQYKYSGDQLYATVIESEKLSSDLMQAAAKTAEFAERATQMEKEIRIQEETDFALAQETAHLKQLDDETRVHVLKQATGSMGR